MKMLSTTTMVNEAAKHRNNDKGGCLAQEQCQMKFLSTKTMTNEVSKHKKNYK